MPKYSEDKALRAKGDPKAKDPRNRHPLVGDGARTYMAGSENLTEALFEITDLFRVPVTNNIPWFEDGDIDRPIYHVSEFIELVEEAFVRHGWTPPQR